MNFLQPDFAPRLSGDFSPDNGLRGVTGGSCVGREKTLSSLFAGSAVLVWLPADHFRHLGARCRVYILRNVRRRPHGGYTEDAGICYGLCRAGVFAGVY